MCRISRAYDAFCDRELDAYFDAPDPEPAECACCNEQCEPDDLTNGECPACAAETAAWAAFCGPRQPALALELYPTLASVHQLPRSSVQPLPLRAAA